MNPSSISEVTQERLEARIKALAKELFADQQVDALEAWHLAQVVDHCSRAISDIYRTVDLGQIVRGEIHPPTDLDELIPSENKVHAPSLGRIFRVPDNLRGLGNQCLYDIGMAGVHDYHGLSLETLGISSYRMAADILSILANERDLRELFKRNRLKTLPIEEEVAFLRQCSTRFTLYASLLTTLREAEDSVSGVTAPRSRVGPLVAEEGSSPSNPEGPLDPSRPIAPKRGLSTGKESRERLLSRYERILLFADMDLESVRASLNQRVISQPEAVNALCDDLLLHATGTQVRKVPRSYFLVGPTGVGKNHLMESLAKVLEETWGIQIPFLVIEGPQYTYPSDINELKGATRGFIRSDEAGLLAEFHECSTRSPISILVVDEIEKAHPQLQKFFLPVMDRGTTLDNRGHELCFEGTFLAFTSNLGYSTQALQAERIGYTSSAGESPDGAQADRHLRRSLSPEFLSRLRVLQFAPLSKQAMESILDLELERVFSRFWALHHLEIRLTPAARARLLEIGFSPSQGARHLAVAVRQHCNIEVSRRIKGDEVQSPEERLETIRYLREIREGDRAFDTEAVEDRVLAQARIRLPYSVLVIDERGGEFLYTGEK